MISLKLEISEQKEKARFLRLSRNRFHNRIRPCGNSLRPGP